MTHVPESVEPQCGTTVLRGQQATAGVLDDKRPLSTFTSESGNKQTPA